MNPPGLPHMPQVQGPQPQPSKYANAYSSSGFDMLGVLVRMHGMRIWTALTAQIDASRYQTKSGDQHWSG